MNRLSPAERDRIRDLVLTHHGDWGGFHAALTTKGRTISQSSIDRFLRGNTDSARTLRMLAVSLSTTPAGLVNQVRLLSVGARSSVTNGNGALKRLRNPDAFQIAFQLWIEMTTRKIGLSIDLTQDLVSECYNSWYAFIKVARELMKTIPLHKDPRSAEMRQLIQLSQAVLNDGLRPHLQRWQARLRRWLASGGDQAQGQALSPQEAQRLFPEWTALSDDLLATNQRLIGYALHSKCWLHSRILRG